MEDPKLVVTDSECFGEACGLFPEVTVLDEDTCKLCLPGVAAEEARKLHPVQASRVIKRAGEDVLRVTQPTLADLKAEAEEAARQEAAAEAEAEAHDLFRDAAAESGSPLPPDLQEAASTSAAPAEKEPETKPDPEPASKPSDVVTSVLDAAKSAGIETPALDPLGADEENDDGL